MHKGRRDAPVLQQVDHPLDGVALADAAQVDADLVGPDADGVLAFVEDQQVHAGMAAGLGHLGVGGRHLPAPFRPPEVLEPADRHVERPARLGVGPRGGLQALERVEADADGPAGRQPADLRHVAGGVEPAEFGLEAVEFLEGGAGGLAGVLGIAAGDEDAPRGGHRLVGEAVQAVAFRGRHGADGMGLFRLRRRHGPPPCAGPMVPGASGADADHFSTRASQSGWRM